MAGIPLCGGYFKIDGKDVQVKVYYLPPDVFGSAPMYLMSTDFPENEEEIRKYTHKLYDHDTNTRVAQNMILGIGGATVVEMLGGSIKTITIRNRVFLKKTTAFF